MGFRQIKGFAEADAEKLMAARGRGYGHPRDLARRAGLAPASIERLAEADAFASLGLSRRGALWAAKGLEGPPPPLLRLLEGSAEPAVHMPMATLGEEVVNDYHALHLTLRPHPLSLLRAELNADQVVPAERLGKLANGRSVRVAGLAITRQRPGEGNIVFVTLEDETGVANIVVRIPVYEAYRRAVLGAALLAVEGRLQIVGDARKGETPVIHVVAERCWDWSSRLGHLLPDKRPRAPAGAGPTLQVQSHDFR